MSLSVRGRRASFIAIALSLSFGLGSSRAGAAPPAPAAEPEITAPGAEGEYLRAVHRRIHLLWADGFVASAHKLAATDKANDPSLRAVVLFSIRWDGTLVDSTLVAASGAEPFDKAAVGSIRRSGPFPVPPGELVSDDGQAHFRWTLSRGAGLCSGGELRRHDDPIEEAIPRMVAEGRTGDALARVARNLDAPSGDQALTIFARTWLSRPLADPVADVAAAVALARSREAGQAKRLQPALARPETAATAAAGLRALGIDVCLLVREGLGAADPSVRRAALLALASQPGGAKEDGAAAPAPAPAASTSPVVSPCVTAEAAMIADAAVPSALRVLAAEVLVATSPEATSRPALIAALADPDATVRAAAVRLTTRLRGGRPALYRTLPFVHDPAVEVRAAAAAAMLRCCGDLALPELVLVFKETDNRPALAVADELGRASTEASADFLGRMGKRNDPAVRDAVKRALRARRDARARAVLATLERSGGVPSAAVPAVTPAFEALLAADRDRQAAEWIVAELERLDQRRKVEVLGAWLTKKAANGTAPVSAR